MRLAVFLLVLLAAGTARAGCALPGGVDGIARADGHAVAYRFEPAPKVGRPFAALIRVCGPAAKLAAVDATMPAHRHGMNYKPTVSETEQGYRAEGFLLHMPGAWEFRFDLRTDAGTKSLRAPFDL